MTGREFLIQLLENSVDEFATAVGKGCGCPNELGLREYCCRSVDDENNECVNCWKKSLSEEV